MSETQINNGKTTWNTVDIPMIVQPETDLFKELKAITNFVDKGNGRYLGQCPFPNHPKKRKNTLYYYQSNDNFSCFACEPNNETSTGKKCFTGGLVELRLKMAEAVQEPAIPEKLPRANAAVRWDIRILSAMLLGGNLTEAQAKGIQALMSTSLGRKLSESEIGKIIELLMLESK